MSYQDLQRGQPASQMSSMPTTTNQTDSDLGIETSMSWMSDEAPTPHNTMAGGEGAFGTQSFASTAYEDGSISNPAYMQPNLSLSPRPSLPHSNLSSSPSSQTTLSSRPSARLLPYHPSSQSLSTNAYSIPDSTVPLPPPPDSVTPSSTFSTDVEAGKAIAKGRSLTQKELDDVRLNQLGYSQVLGRDYTFWSSLSISWVNIGALQGTIFAVAGTYKYGGPNMILVAWPVAGVFATLLTFALAELASAYPVAGAMASWSWKAARGGVGGERWWGWLMGGVVLGGHVGNIVLVTWQLSKVITGAIHLSNEGSYHVQAWQQMLMYLGCLSVAGGIGSTAWGRSPRFWISAGLYVFAMWFVVCVSLIATNTHRAPSFVFQQPFETVSGWDNRALIYILGWVYTSIACGADASAHMSEETQNPSRNVPNAMVASVAATYICGYVSIFLLLLSVDPETAREASSHSFPAGFLLAQSLTRKGAIAVLCLLVVALVFQVTAQLQASSRFLWAMARDQAFPFSDVIKRTNSKKLPNIATWIVLALSAPLSFLLLTQSGIMYSLIAVSAGSISYVGYIIPVVLYLLSGKDLQVEGRTSWSLRRWSKPIGFVGALYGTAVVVCMAFPSSYPLNAESISWSPIVMAVMVLASWLTWWIYGDAHYSGPIRAVTKWETGVELDIQSTLHSRSRSSAPQHSGGDGVGVKAESPYFPSIIRTVTVSSGMPSMHRGDSDQSGSDSSSSTVTRDTNRGRVVRYDSSMGELKEEAEARASADDAVRKG